MPNKMAPECECSVIAHMAAEPNFPITYDVKMQEWHIVGADGAKATIYHCFFCGGRMPRSRREDFFHTVSDAESRRLFDLTNPPKTVADVVAAYHADHLWQCPLLAAQSGHPVASSASARLARPQFGLLQHRAIRSKSDP
ncbi:DUF6980 family protein [Dongia sp. agr-C8]